MPYMSTRLNIIHSRLEAEFSPLLLTIHNQSDQHLGHSGHDGGGESHFEVILVSPVFEGLARVERQKRVYAILNDLFAQGLHALSLQLKTPKEHAS
jgi:BolA family transcriptional regulator, general stress-responsive regulator